MVTTDTLNGFTMSKLIYRADRRAAIASRIMSVAVALLSLLVAGMGLAKLYLPVVEETLKDLGLTVGVAVVVAMVAAFVLAMRVAKSAPAAQEG